MRQFITPLALAFSVAAAAAQTNTNPLTREVVRQAETLTGLDFSDAKLDLMLPGLKAQRDNFETLRRFPLSNAVPPALQFNPLPVFKTFQQIIGKSVNTFRCTKVCPTD